MLYCETCKILYDGEPGAALKCPECGKKRGRAPMAGDFVYLSEQPAPWNGMLGDVLAQNSIPFTTRSNMGAGLALAVGPMLEAFKFFVPLERYDDARAVVEGLFPDEDGAFDLDDDFADGEEDN